MYKEVPTLTDHLLAGQKDNNSGLFPLLHQIENGAKLLASHIKKTGLVELIGKTGTRNVFDEEVQKLDEFSNEVLVSTILNSGQAHAVVSEEMERPVHAPKESSGDLNVFIDPLDGSSNIDTNCPIGTIFSIYDKSDGLLQQGKKQVAAGYVIYGSSVMFVYSAGQGVNGFTLDPAVGSFFLSHPDMKIPEAGDIYSINEGYGNMYDQGTKDYLNHLKNEGKSRGRFVGSLVADAHRTFVKGGIFLYPAYEKQPEGKLRLMLEVNPFAYLTEQAGGKTIGRNNKSPLETEPKHIHERSPFIMGSPENVEVYKRFAKNP